MRIPFLIAITLTILLPFSALCQEIPVYTDTSYFIPSEPGYNLVMSASQGHTENVRVLLAQGVDPDAATPDGITSLMYAADAGNLEMVKLLLDQGASPNLMPVGGITALMSAVLGDYFEVAEYLVTHGADADLRDESGITALHYAAAYNLFRITDMLIYYKASTEITDHSGNTPLITAAYNNCPETVEILVRNGANINATDKNGFTPLMVSIQNGNDWIIKYLLDQGADIGKANKAGLTALAISVKTGNYALTQRLIKMGANVNKRISMSSNILELAKEEKDEEIIQLLLSNGAKPDPFPNFNYYTAGMGMNFNAGDFSTSADVGIEDSRYYFALRGGFAFRPKAVKVLIENNPSLFHQYRERRYFLFLDLEKKFRVLRISNNFTAGPLFGLGGVYTFGSYIGSDKSPGRDFHINPYAGWYFANEWMNISIDYNYLNLKTEYINPSRFALNIGFMFPARKSKTLEKQIGWLKP